jgi:DNA-binding NarL/FixJ family response regulator
MSSKLMMRSATSAFRTVLFSRCPELRKTSALHGALSMSSQNTECENISLTARELEVVRLVSSGLPNKSIAHRLGVQEGTVKIHLYHVYKKLSVTNRTALALVCLTSKFGQVS